MGLENYSFLIRISTVLISWHSHMYAFPPQRFKDIVKKSICDNTRISTTILKTNVISTCLPPKITTGVL